MRKGIRYAIDYGDQRIGLAKSDVDAIMAVPVATIKNDEFALKNLLEHLNETGYLDIYIGLPKHLSGVLGQSALKAQEFARKLSAEIDVDSIRMLDERLTTTSASARLQESGVNTRNQKSIIDQAAAVELLEFALDSEKRTGNIPGLKIDEVK